MATIGYACIAKITGHDGKKIEVALGPVDAPGEEPNIITTLGGAQRRQQTAQQVMQVMQGKIQTPPGKAPFSAGTSVVEVEGDPADPKTWKYVAA